MVIVPSAQRQQLLVAVPLPLFPLEPIARKPFPMDGHIRMAHQCLPSPRRNTDWKISNLWSYLGKEALERYILPVFWGYPGFSLPKLSSCATSARCTYFVLFFLHPSSVTSPFHVVSIRNHHSGTDYCLIIAPNDIHYSQTALTKIVELAAAASLSVDCHIHLAVMWALSRDGIHASFYGSSFLQFKVVSNCSIIAWLPTGLA